jgi:hypothetical protein
MCCLRVSELRLCACRMSGGALLYSTQSANDLGVTVVIRDAAFIGNSVSTPYIHIFIHVCLVDICI